MNRQTKWMSIALLVVVALVAVFALAACDETPSGPTEPTLVSIAVDASGAKTTYFAGDEFSADGIKVTATMSDETVKEIAKTDYTLSTPDMTKIGEQDVTVTYQGKTATYKITVSAITVESIALDTTNVKTSYFVGDAFSTEGLKITATMSDKQVVEVKLADAEISAPDMTTAGEKTITVTYGGKSATYKITVSAITVESIALDTANVKTSYFVGDTFSTEGLKITATMSDKHVVEVKLADAEISAPDMTTAGEKTITVTYGGKSATFKITLEAITVTSLSVDATEAKTAYIGGEDFIADGIVVVATMNNGSTKTLTDDEYELTEPQLTTAGEHTVTVSYQGKTATYKVSVKVITEIDYNGAELKVAIGETVNFEGEVDVVYSDETTGTLSVDSEFLNKKLPEFKMVLGRACNVRVESKLDATVGVDIPVIIERFLQGESAAIVGGKVVEEGEYIVKDGQIVDLQAKTAAAGGFGNAAINGKDAYVEFGVVAYTDSVGDITLRCANSFLKKDDDGYYMQALQINTIADLYVNGTAVTIGDDVVLQGIDARSASYAPVYNIYSTFTFADVSLKVGYNVIRLQFKPSTIGETNHWNESPSSMNIDWISVTSTGVAAITGDVQSIEIENVEFDSDGNPEPTVVATTANGKYTLDKSEYELTTVVNAPAVTITVTLKANTEVKDSYSYNDIRRFEAESGTIFGKADNGKAPSKKTATEKIINEDGTTLSTGNTIGIVGGFDAASSAKNSNDDRKNKVGSDVGLTVTINGNGTYKLYIRMANNAANGDGTCNEIDMTKLMKVEIDGVALDLTGKVVPGSTIDGSQYDVYWEIELGTVTVNGEAELKLTYFAGGPEGNGLALNRWSENPACNLDWFELRRAA